MTDDVTPNDATEGSERNEDAASDSNPTETTTADSNPTETTTADSNPTETTTADSNPTETTTADSNPTETTTADSNPTETTTADSNPTETTTADSNPTETTTADRAAELRAQAQSGPAISVEEFRRKSRRLFITGAAGIVGAGILWNYVQTKSDPIDGIPGVLRNTLEANEAIWSNFEGRSAPEYAISDASPIQVNGRVGIRDDISLVGYTVVVEGPDGEVLDELPIDHFRNLPQSDLVIEHKCIEGWSNITHWRGARFRDFHEPYADRIGDASYVGLETPDGEYYVGWDLDAILHPQTMLALEQNGEPLDQDHGAPIRLATPNKYGIKTIKRIKTIRYRNARTADYWAERSYDWYAGL